jgi:hypothetical protein
MIGVEARISRANKPRLLIRAFTNAGSGGPPSLVIEWWWALFEASLRLRRLRICDTGLCFFPVCRSEVEAWSDAGESGYSSSRARIPWRTTAESPTRMRGVSETIKITQKQHDMKNTNRSLSTLAVDCLLLLVPESPGPAIVVLSSRR